MQESHANEPAAKIRVLLVEDHPLIRDGYRCRIGTQPDMEVCGEAASVDEALALSRDVCPDVAVVDVSLKASHGIDFVRTASASQPQLRTVVVTAYDESIYAERALRAGALGYVNKCDASERILEAIRAVRAGRRYLSTEMTQSLLNRAVGGPSADVRDPVTRLSDRELEVFRMIGNGLTTSAIAHRLFLSVHTIDTHREKIRHKLGLKNSHELMRYAIQWTLEHAS